MMLTIPPNELLNLGNAYGLPLYIYDAGMISRQVALLQQAFHPFVPELHYACKASNAIGLLRHIHGQGCGIDAVSVGEIKIAEYAGIPPEDISFTPNGVLPEEYEYAIARGIHIHVDQFHIMEWLDRNHPGIEVTIRLNPGVQAGGHHKLQVGAAGSKFGFPASRLAELKAWTDQHRVNIIGVHMHLGSDIGETESFDKAYSFLLEAAMLWKDSLQHVDLGGGFKVPYHPQDHATDILHFGQQVSQKFEAFCNTIGRQVKLVFEPGKFLVSQAGYLLFEVTSVRESGATDMVYVNSGFNHFLRPMNYSAYHHILNLSHPEGIPNSYDVVGYLCETDTFALDRQLPEVREGDVLCLCNAGAYGYTMSSNYNARMRPAELLWDNGTHTALRRRETIEDLLRTDLGFV